MLKRGGGKYGFICRGVAVAVLGAACRAGAESGAPAGREAPPAGAVRVVLQLQGRHRFEFAGYYLAKEKGYYRDAGFDVEFRERLGNVNVIEEVAKGRADFGVSDTWLIPEYLQGAPVVVTAAVLQHSPRAVLATEKSGIRTLRDLGGKRVAMSVPRPDLGTMAMLAASGVSIGGPVVVPPGEKLDALVDGRADAVLGNVTDEPYELQRRGIPFVVFRARDCGADFYSELLFTSRQMARGRPERVRAFRDASLCGWAYAVSHEQEAIDLIVRDYAPDADRDRLEHEAREFRGLMAADLIEIGHVNPERWRNMVRALAEQLEASAMEKAAGGDLLFDDQAGRSPSRWVRILATGLLAVGAVAAGLGLVVILLRSMVRRRTAELHEANRRLTAENAERLQAEALLLLQRDLALVIGEAATLQACLDRFLELTLKIPGLDACGLFLVPPQREELELVAWRNVAVAWATASAVIQPGSPVGELIFRGKTVQLGRQDLERMGVEPAWLGDYQAFLAVPVAHEARVIASLHIASRQPLPLSVNTVATVESLALMMGGAIVRLRGKEECLRVRSNLEALFLTVEDMLFIVGMDGRVLEASPSVCRFLGYAREEVVGMRLDQLHAEGDGDRVRKTLAGVVDGTLNVCALPVRRRDGSLLPVETKVVRGRWSGQDVIFGVSRDMRERLRTEEAQRQSEERFRMIVEHAGVGLMVVSEAGQLLFHNGVMGIVGLEAEEAARLGHEQVCVRTCGAQYLARLRSVLASGGTTEYCNLLSVNGETRWIEIMMRPFPSGPQDPPSVLVVTKDVTAQQRMLAALQESETNFRNLAENAMDLIAIINREGQIVYVSSRVGFLLGYTVEEAEWMPLRELVPPPLWEKVQARFLARMEGGLIATHYETELLHKEGLTVPVELASNLVVWHNATCLMVSVRDISERHRAEAALRESESVFRSVAESAFDAIVVADTDGRYRYVNTRATEMLGYSREELLGSSFERVLHPRETKRLQRQFANRLAGRPVPALFEAVFCCRDGRAIPAEIAVKECEMQGKRVFVSVYKDISERKRMEREILKISEWEKARIGQDLHDSIGQQLVGMAYLVEALEHDLRHAGSPHAPAASQLAQSCKAAHSQLRHVVRGVLPVRMDGGLASALEGLAEDVRSQMGVACAVRCDFDAAGLNLGGVGHLYRIAQEAVTNAVRHGKARHLQITLVRDGDEGELRIDDDGVGFNPAAAGSGGSGLKIMRYRADMVRGRLSVARGETGGMSVRCTFDVAQAMDLNQEVDHDESE